MSQLIDRKQKEKEFFDAFRGELATDPRYHPNDHYYELLAPRNRDFVKQWLADRCTGKRVLDYCCGNGSEAIWIAQAGAYVHGFDISPVSVQNASAEAIRQRVDHQAVFSVMDAEALAFPDDCFDLINVAGVLHHLGLEAAYREMARVLKPGGEAICVEALRHNPIIHLYRKLTPHLRTAWEVDHILGKKEIQLAKKYFRTVEVARFFHFLSLGSVPFRKLSIFPWLLKTSEAIDSFLFKLPIVKWQAWMAVFVLADPKKPRRNTQE